MRAVDFCVEGNHVMCFVDASPKDEVDKNFKIVPVDVIKVQLPTASACWQRHLIFISYNLFVKIMLNKLNTSKMQNKVGLDTEILFSIVHIDD